MDEPTAVADIYNRTVKEKRRGTIEIKRQQESPLDKIVRLADESTRKAINIEGKLLKRKNSALLYEA